jgi:hypothetical protein
MTGARYLYAAANSLVSDPLRYLVRKEVIAANEPLAVHGVAQDVEFEFVWQSVPVLQEGVC